MSPSIVSSKIHYEWELGVRVGLVVGVGVGM